MRYAVTIALILVLVGSADAQTTTAVAPVLVTPKYVAPSLSAGPPPVTLAPSAFGPNPFAPTVEPGVPTTLTPPVTSPGVAIGNPTLAYGSNAFHFGQPGVPTESEPPQTSSLNEGTITEPVPTNPTSFVPTNPDLNGIPGEG